MFRRGAVYYSQERATGKQTSLRTKDETEARSLLNARKHNDPRLTANTYTNTSLLSLRDAVKN